MHQIPDDTPNNTQTCPTTLQNYYMSSNLIPTLLSLALVIAVTSKEGCRCLNGGSCSPINHCDCPPAFIGERCEIHASELTEQATHATLTSNFTYFYYQPTEVNYYRLTFNICVVRNPSLLPSIFYIETEKSNGSLRTVHYLFETAKLELGQKGCVSFSTHYISIKPKDSQNYRKIVVGLKALDKDDSENYLNVYRSQEEHRSATTPLPTKPPQPLPHDFAFQSITVRMTYEKYLQTTEYSKFVVILIACFLVVVLGVFIYYLRKRYGVGVQDRLSEFQEFDLSRYRYHTYHNPETDRRRRNKIECIEVFMPATRYGQKGWCFVPDSMTSFEEVTDTREDSCSICLSSFSKEDEIRTTPCRHQYHRECIDNWCGSKLSCPICRRPLDFRKQIRKIYLHFLRGEIIL